jgi:phage shock protein PspC (stress-responsive transcriptional regulator)
MSNPYSSQPPKRLVRSTSNRVIGGVCGGVADYLNMDATLVRVLPVLISLRAAAGHRCVDILRSVHGPAVRDPAARVRALPERRGGSGRNRATDRRGHRLGQ